MSVKLRMTDSKILVQPLPPPEKTAGGILFNPGWQTPRGEGRVVAKGPRATEVRRGDLVMFNWLDAVSLEYGPVPLQVIRQEQLIGVRE